ncbi:MAG: histidine kinase [Nitrospiraceae bacterium]|nr:histidine kinase [Nitrospiraceae bacterium]
MADAKPHRSAGPVSSKLFFSKLSLDMESSSLSQITELQELLSLEDALYKTNLLLQNIFEHIHTPIAYLDTHMKILKSNTAFRRLTGTEHGDIDGTALFSFFMDKELLQACRKALKTAKSVTLYSKVFTPSEPGQTYWDISIQPVKSTGVNIDSIILFAFNVTEKIAMQDNVHRMQELFRTAVENIPKCFGIYTAIRDENGEIKDFKIEYLNKAALSRIKGSESIPFIFQGGQSGYNTGRQMQKEFAAVVNTGRSISKEFICYDSSAEGSAMAAAYDLKAVKLKDGVAAFWSDITEKKLTNQKLEESKEQLRKLTLHMQSTREEERTRIARELHDELGQSLTALKMDISWLHSRLSGNAEMQKKISLSLHLINATIQSVKKICSDLRPSMLDHLGLSAAIEWEAAEFERRTGIKCSIDMPDEELNIEKTLLTNLFRVFQETLTNITRHSHATEASVSMKLENGQIVLKVSDNGVGIKDKDLINTSSFGIIGMNERMYHCNGTVDIEGHENMGTCVTVHVPMKKSEP